MHSYAVRSASVILILALDVARDTDGVPALAGRASANPHRVDCLTRHRLKAGLRTFQNENCWFRLEVRGLRFFIPALHRIALLVFGSKKLALPTSI